MLDADLEQPSQRETKPEKSSHWPREAEQEIPSLRNHGRETKTAGGTQPEKPRQINQARTIKLEKPRQRNHASKRK